MSVIFDVINLSLEPSEEFREDIDTLRQTSPDLWEAFNGEYKKLERLLQNGADVNTKTKYGNTALIIASWLNKVDLVNLLLRYGANMHIQNNKKETALSTAISMRNTRIVQMLEHPPPQQRTVVQAGDDGPCSPVLAVPKLDPRIAMMGRCRDVNLPAWMTRADNTANTKVPRSSALPNGPQNQRRSDCRDREGDQRRSAAQESRSEVMPERCGRSRDVNLPAWMSSNGNYGSHANSGSHNQQSHSGNHSANGQQDRRQFEDARRGAPARSSSPVDLVTTRSKRSFHLACEPIEYPPAQLQRPAKFSNDSPPEPNSWLADRLRRENIAADWVLLCEEQLVQEQGFGTAKALASVPTERFSRGYLNRLGITAIGVQQVLFIVHEDLHNEYLELRAQRRLLDEQPELSDHFVILRSAAGSDVASQASSNAPSQHTQYVVVGTCSDNCGH